MKRVDNNQKKTTDCDVEVLWNVDLSNEGIYLMTTIYKYSCTEQTEKSFINEFDEIEK